MQPKKTPPFNNNKAIKEMAAVIVYTHNLDFAFSINKTIKSLLGGSERQTHLVSCICFRKADQNNN
jgi:hypothetical protein